MTQQLHSKYLPERNKNIGLQKCPKLEMDQVPINRMDKPMCHIYATKYYSAIKKNSALMTYNMEELC